MARRHRQTTLVPCAFAESLPLTIFSCCPALGGGQFISTRRGHVARRAAFPSRPASLARVFMCARPGGLADTTGSELENLLENPNKRRYCFVTAKGGCGKTTTSAALALKMADEDIPTLAISIDPAHSLGDALRVDLSDGKLHRLEPNVPLYALECDTSEAVREFQTLISGLRGAADSATSEQPGWGDVAGMLDTIPPGADEFIALISLLKLVEDKSEGIEFKRIGMHIFVIFSPCHICCLSLISLRAGHSKSVLQGADPDLHAAWYMFLCLLVLFILSG